MKLRKFIAVITLIVTVGVSTAYIVNKTDTVDAKTNIAVFPKRMRGTWYYYSKNSNKLSKQVIRKRSFKANEEGYKYKRSLHVNPTGNAYDYNGKNKNRLNWVFFSNKSQAHGYSWLVMRGWYQTSGAGSYFNVSELNGNQVLTIAGGAGVWGSQHYYRSPKLALQLKNRKYSGFKY